MHHVSRPCLHLLVSHIHSVLQFWALYCLVALYHATHHALEEISPLRKFVTIKMVVFFSFWQGLLLSVLGSLHLIGNREWTTYQYHDLTAGVQSMIVCIECLPAALAFAWAFPPRDYMEPGQAPGSFMANVKSMFDVRDIFTDVAELVDDQVRRRSAYSVACMLLVSLGLGVPLWRTSQP